MSAGGERIMQQLEVWLLEERFCRADRVRRVGDNHVVRGGVLFEELEAISDVDRDTRVRKEG